MRLALRGRPSSSRVRRAPPELVPAESRTVTFLDPEERVLIGDVTLLTGAPQAGKSMLVAKLAATTGPALILTNEDRPEVVRARVEFAGGDPDSVHVMHEVMDRRGRRSVHIPTDVPSIEAAIERLGVKLVVIDPISGFLAPGVLGTIERPVRDKVMAPLRALAARTGTAMILVLHTARGRNGQPQLDRVGASRAFTAVARSVLMFGPRAGEDDDPFAQRLLVHVKSSDRQPAETEVFELVQSDDGRTARLESIGTTDERTLTPRRRRESPAVDEAEAFLRMVLADGPVSVPRLRALASERGLGWRSIETAKARLGVQSRRPGGSGSWVWALEG